MPDIWPIFQWQIVVVLTSGSALGGGDDEVRCRA
jgi:hypothetical protein